MTISFLRMMLLHIVLLANIGQGQLDGNRLETRNFAFFFHIFYNRTAQKVDGNLQAITSNISLA